MRIFGLIGYPLGHSFSKKYFTEKFSKENIYDCIYENYPMENLEKLPELINGNPDLCGLNVTIPHKTGILKFIDAAEPETEEIGAANVLKIKRTGKAIRIHGFNSDVTGIAHSVNSVFQGRPGIAVILGTGGSSLAVSYTLKKLGFRVAVVSRSEKPGTLSYRELNADIIESADLIVNTTPLGMFPNITARPDINYNLLNEKHTLFDLVYNPEITTFLKMGQERGCRIITGLTMLYSQAERSWEIWNDPNL